MKKWAGFNVLSFGRTDTCCERERESVSCRRQRAIAGPQTPDGVGVVGLGAYSGQGAWNSVEAQRGDSIPCCQLGMHLVHRNSFCCQVSITAQYTINAHTARPPHE